ncbi:HAD family hydrolase [Candidatus Bathyarchaeota archaeon]|nr:HAD family hydrolase [Candidatus Bathyarchaeota archaeon]
MLNKKAFIFDFDYTLGDSSHGIHDCINHGLTRLGFSPVPYEKACEAIGLSLPDTLVHFTGEEHRVKSDEFYSYFMEKAMEVMVQKCVMYPDAEDTLRYLESQGLRLAIASTKHRHRIDAILSKYSLLDYFSVIVGGEDVSAHKPDPMVLLQVLDRLGLEPGECVYVGDNVVDAQAAERADVDFVAVLTGLTSYEEFCEYPRMAVIRSLSELKTLTGFKPDV